MRRAGAFAALGAVAALSACNLEPKFVQPTPAIPASWPAGDAYLRRSEAALPSLSYRDIFRDPALQAIIARALANNQDIRAALANVAAARADYRVQRAQLLPQVDASAQASFFDRGGANNFAGGGTGAGGGAGSSQSYQLNLGSTAFEIDLFGRLRNLSAAALREYLATEAGVRAARLTIVADVATLYLTLAADRSLLAVAADTERSAGESVRITGLRLRGGIAPRSDLRQAETILAQARSDRANLTTLVAQDRNALELLVGGPVADAELPSGLEAVDGLLAELPAGLDSRVLLRRPDIVQAEYRLRAANARIGAARAAFFPTIGLTALTGLASSALGALFSSGAFSWSVAPLASLPIFDGGARRGNLAFARAQFELASATYQRTVQVAFREVADALARRGTIPFQLSAQRDLVAAAEDTLRLEQARYREGINPYLNTLDAQRTFYQARRALASARLVRATNLVQLYRTLGGDERLDGPASPPAAPR